MGCEVFLSISYASPAFAAEMIPARWTRESVKVDFPWSTWAITLMFLIFDIVSSRLLLRFP